MPPSAQLHAFAKAPADVLEDIPCAVCGADDVEFLHAKATPEGEVFPIVQCRKCRLVYVSPRRRQETLNEVYRTSVYFQTGNDKASGYSDYMGDRELHAIFFRQQLATIEGQVKVGRLLDVGCATGFLLDEARKRGWETEGVELSEFASAYARKELKLSVFNGTLREAKYPDGHFDAVVMDDVIEHVGDPEIEMKEVHRILRPGGVVILHTPNADSPWYAVMGKHWIHLKPGQHLYFFSPRTLTTLMKRVGFDVLHARARGKTTDIAYILGRGKDYVHGLGAALQRLGRALPGAHIPFPFRSGEMEMFAVRK